MAKESGHSGLTPDRIRAAVRTFFRREDLPDLRDLFAFGGLAAACYGIAQIHAPAAWIVGGVALFWLGVRR